MSTKKPFKVVIAGGSIAGLSLANMLQQNGIDYVLLEAYPDIAPQVGASIGLSPHGTRILDQLGIAEDIAKLVAPLDRFYFRNNRGELLVKHEGVAHSFEERHGYAMHFLDRQLVLQVLYDHLEDKEKVFVRKRVERVDTLDQGVRVTTQDGSVYTGDILVGADGVHSTVRDEMRRIGNEVDKENFPASEKREVPCDYATVFGISTPCPGIKAGSLTSVFGDHRSYLVLGGLDDRAFWFHNFKIGKERLYGPDIPRFTKADEETVLKARENDVIMPSLTFGDIVKKKVSSNMSPLIKYTYRKWHFGRIITIGDAAHTFEPIGGHGGNAAIEGGAILMNNLVQELNKSPTGTLNDSQISTIFAKVQNTRYARAQKLIADSYEQQRVEAMDTPFYKFLALKVVPWTDTEDVLFNISRNVPQGVRLDMLDLPPRPLLIPFNDQLGGEIHERGWWGWIISGVLFVTALFAYWALYLSPTGFGMKDFLISTIKDAKFSNGVLLRETYSGIPWIDKTLTIGVAKSLPGISHWDRSLTLLQLEYEILQFSLVVVWSVEACRKRNALTLLSFTSIWAILSQVWGLSIILSIYYISYVLTSKNETYWWPLSRPLPAPKASTLLPSLLLGYLIPTSLSYYPYSNTDAQTTQLILAITQPALRVIYINFLLAIFSTIHGKLYPQDHTTPDAGKVLPDMKPLNRIYLSSFTISSILHLWTVITIFRNPELTFTRVFLPHFKENTISVWTDSIVDGMRSLWQADLCISSVVTVLCCWLAEWDLKRMGRSKTDLVRFGGWVLVGCVLVGPGAVLLLVWWARERKIGRTLFR